MFRKLRFIVPAFVFVATGFSTSAVEAQSAENYRYGSNYAQGRVYQKDLNTGDIEFFSFGAQPRGVALSHDGSTLYAVDGGGTEVLALNAITMEEKARVHLASDAHPSAVVPSKSGERIYVTTTRDRSVFVLDPESLSVLHQTEDLGNGNPLIELDEKGNRILAFERLRWMLYILDTETYETREVRLPRNMRNLITCSDLGWTFMLLEDTLSSGLLVRMDSDAAWEENEDGVLIPHKKLEIPNNGRLLVADSDCSTLYTIHNDRVMRIDVDSLEMEDEYSVHMEAPLDAAMTSDDRMIMVSDAFYTYDLDIASNGEVSRVNRESSLRTFSRGAHFLSPNATRPNWYDDDDSDDDDDGVDPGRPGTSSSSSPGCSLTRSSSLDPTLPMLFVLVLMAMTTRHRLGQVGSGD